MRISEENMNMMLAESTIMDYEFDLYRNEVRFNLILLDDYKRTVFYVVFNGVTAFNYVLRDGDIDPCYINIEDKRQYYLEFTSIIFLDDAKIKFESDSNNWLSQYIPKYNIAIEIYDRILLLSASSITIDGKNYTF